MPSDHSEKSKALQDLEAAEELSAEALVSSAKQWQDAIQVLLKRLLAPPKFVYEIHQFRFRSPGDVDIPGAFNSVGRDGWEVIHFGVGVANNEGMLRDAKGQVIQDIVLEATCKRQVFDEA
jgi:hypothetical protein